MNNIITDEWQKNIYFDRPRGCEQISYFVKNFVYNNADYEELINEGILKIKQLVWIELDIPNFGKLEGFFLRTKFKRMKFYNLVYEFNETLYNINTIIKYVEYLPSKLKDIKKEKKVTFNDMLNFELYIPKKALKETGCRECYNDYDHCKCFN